MSARWTETTLRVDLDDHTDFTVDTSGLPDGDVRLSFCSTPPVEVLMSRECAEVLEDRIRWTRLRDRRLLGGDAA